MQLQLLMRDIHVEALNENWKKSFRLFKTNVFFPDTTVFDPALGDLINSVFYNLLNQEHTILSGDTEEEIKTLATAS